MRWKKSRKVLKTRTSTGRWLKRYRIRRTCRAGSSNG